MNTLNPITRRRAGHPWPQTICCLLATALLGASGCADRSIDVAGSDGQANAGPPKYSDLDWATILGKHVRNGSVNYQQIAANVGPLDNYLAQLAKLGPRSSPDQFAEPNAALAYYLNAYNATIIKIALTEGIPPTLHNLVSKRRLDYHYRFRIDGRMMTPADLRQAAWDASENNARIVFALCNGAVGSPPLPSTPLRAAGLDAQLADIARRALDSPQMVRIDHGEQQILVALVIWDTEDRLEALYMRETNSPSGTMLNILLHLASPERRSFFTRATGYTVRAMPFDRRLNGS